MAFTPSKRKADAMAMYSPSPKKAKVLTLEERIKVLEKSESGMSARMISTQFSCGKTQIQNILKNKEQIRAEWEKGKAGDRKYLTARRTQYVELNERVWDWKGGKKAKERITLLLCCSATGEKLEPLIIGKSANPRCFRGINVRTLNIRYESNRRAWMTRDIFVAWLKSLNNKFRRQNRKILLFVDNCSAHPDIQLSNIKLKFLPPNTTSKLQPCDAGIIQTLKANYRIQLVNHILWHINECASASELAKSVTVLDAMKMGQKGLGLYVAQNNCKVFYKLWC